jgi:hypothetical protein
MRYKKKIIFLSMLLALTVLNTQGQETENKTDKKWSFGLNFSPDYCYRTLRGEAASPLFLNSRNETENPKLGYTAGASILWRIHRMVELESGLRYSDKGYKTDKLNLSWVSNHVNLPSNYHIVYRYQYFNIPVKLNYYLINTKLRLFVTGGISINIFNRQQTKLILEEADGSRSSTVSENDLGFSTLNFSVLVGGGILYPVTKSWAVRLQPLYRMSLTPLRPSEGLKEKLFSTGMEVGLYYTLK